MKRIVCFALCTLFMCLFGCTKTPEPSVPRITVTVENEATEADIWIIPDTEANRKTTVWGTTTVGKLAKNSAVTAQATQDEAGQYLFRMIDVDGYYYAASGIALSDGYTLRLKVLEGVMQYALEVSDASGEILETYEVFCARL